jgi:hypothetical protein
MDEKFASKLWMEFFNGNENFEKMKTQKIQINKIKIYTVVGLDWCQTCSLCL